MSSDITRRRLFAGGSGLLGGYAIGASAAQGAGAAQAASGDLAAAGARADGTATANAALERAFAAQSATKPFRDPATRQFLGVGPLTTPKGDFRFDPIGWGRYDNVGMTIGGAGRFATTWTFSIADGRALPLQRYVGARVHDLSLLNTRGADPADRSVAIDVDPTGTGGANRSGGGGMLSIERVDAHGFGTFLRNFGTKLGGIDTGDGDKTLVEMCNHYGAVCYDQTANKQAYGWMFLCCAGGARDAAFRLGGSGLTSIVGYVGDPRGSFLHFPEGSGNSGPSAPPGGGTGGNYPWNKVVVQASQLEYHGDGDRMLIDARRSRRPRDAGGSTADVTLDDVTFASGSAWPDPASHVVIQVGDRSGGSDGVRVNARGGWVAGRIRLGASALGAVNTRWSFRDMSVAPDPATVDLVGPAGASHPLIEWRANESVPVDQYRGGQAFTGSVDAQKAHLCGHSGAFLINTGLPDAQAAYGARRGKQMAIPMARGLNVTGMGVFVHETPGEDTLVEWFATGGGATWRDAAGGNRLVASATVPAGARRGALHPVAMLDPARWLLLEDGAAYVRITKPGTGQQTVGRLVLFYFPLVAG